MSDTPNIGEALTKKIGPLPGWAYVAILAVGIYGYKHYHPTIVTPAPTAYTDTSSTGTASNIPPQQLPQDLVNAGNQLSPQEWASQVTDYLNQSTPYSSNAIDTALNNFLTGASQQNSQLQTIIDHATAAMTPPQSVIDASQAVSRSVDTLNQTLTQLSSSITGFQNTYPTVQPSTSKVSGTPNPNLPFIPGTFTPLHYATGETTAPAAAAAGIQMGNVPQKKVPHGAYDA